MDRHELNRMFDGLAPGPQRERELLKKLRQEDGGRSKPVKNWKQIVAAAAAAALLVTGAAAAAGPELLERLTIQLFFGANGTDEGYTVSGSPMTKYPLSAFSPELLAASEGREGPCAPVSLIFDTWEEVKTFLGEGIPCVWPGDGENWNGWFQVILFHTEYDVLWGIDIIGCDLKEIGAEVEITIRTELWRGSGASGGLGLAEGSLEPLGSYTMPSGTVAEIIQYCGPEEAPYQDCTGYFMREGILYKVTALKTLSTEGTEDQLKEILDSFRS